MHDMVLHAQRLSDDALLASARTLAGRERRLTARLVAHLSEIAVRGLAQREGCGSLFDYCRRVLGMSESEAWARVEVANAVRRFPAMLGMLLANELTITTAARLARHLTPENHEAVLRAARGMTKEQVKMLVAELEPKPDAPVVLRRMPAPPAAQRLAGIAFTSAAPPAVAAVAPTPPATASVRAAAPSPASVTPLAPERFRYQVTIDGETRQLLSTARDLASHAGADDAALLKQALSLLVAELSRRKHAATSRPRSAAATGPHSRHIPAAVKREVWERDGGRCAFTSPGGRRCEGRRLLEFHHVRPWQAGGDATPGNIQLRCRAHNQYEARVFFSAGREAGHGGTGHGETAPGGVVPRASGHGETAVDGPTGPDRPRFASAGPLFA